MAKMHALRLWRLRNEVTLDELAEIVGVEGPHLSMIERGLRSPSIGLAAKLSKATGHVVHLEEFVRRELA